MAFLSIRVPDEVRNRVKAVAAARGENLQDLIGTLLERFLEEAERKPPELADVLRRLRTIEASLRSRGVASLWVFGSVARGEARPDSDVDVLVEFEAGKTPGMAFFLLPQELEPIFGRSVDLTTRAAVEANENHLRRASILESAVEVYAQG